MQPRTIALLVTLLPLISANTAYVLSASAGYVPWCLPYIDGCTTVSRAARSGDSIFIFRAMMMFYAILLIGYWWVARLWLIKLDQQCSKLAQIVFWLGTTGAVFLIIYIDFLGTSGIINQFMRLYGVIFYFSLTPLAHMLMLNHLKKLKIKKIETPVTINILRYQTMIIILILITGLCHIVISYTGQTTYESQNVIEWNYSLLLALFFASSIFMWKDLKLKLELKTI